MMVMGVRVLFLELCVPPPKPPALTKQRLIKSLRSFIYDVCVCLGCSSFEGYGCSVRLFLSSLNGTFENKRKMQWILFTLVANGGMKKDEGGGWMESRERRARFPFSFPSCFHACMFHSALSLALRVLSLFFEIFCHIFVQRITPPCSQIGVASYKPIKLKTHAGVEMSAIPLCV
jgi:hypothetical protein